MKKIKDVIHLMLLLLGLAMSATHAKADDLLWNYAGDQGPDHWGGLCATGQQQSPIDISKASIAKLPDLHFDYNGGVLKLVDNGHTLRVNVELGSKLVIDQKQYDLVQFHFHHPSEETINGKAYDLVAHLVHKSADDQYVVVAVLFTLGKANPLIDRVWSQWPHIQNKETSLPLVLINPDQLLPEKRGYYTFPGSLTTPPCTEGIKWYVLKTPMEISKEQLARIAGAYPHNARPIQAINARLVQQTVN